MTLRVKLEIIPHGDEDKAYTIETINISNIERIGWDEYIYVIEHNEYKKYNSNTPTIEHLRTEGPLVLVQKAIQKLLKKE